MRMSWTLLIGGIVVLLLALIEEAQDEKYSEKALLGSAPPGPYIRYGPERAAPKGCTARDPIVLTYYFYWYDDETGAHFIDHDGTDALTDHPINPKGYSYKRVEWHRRELLDIMDAGIDVILPVYWGNPADRMARGPLNWSDEGMPPLVKAVEQLAAEGRKPPKIGLFYDTSTLQYNAAGRRIDLSTPEGRAWFYVTIRDFFSHIPPNQWATIDGRPLVFLYAAAFASGGTDDPKLIEYVREHFARDFGGTTPYIVKEVSWRLPADSSYAWGAAFGLKVFGVAAVGPGYDDSAVPGRTTPKQDRENGTFYRRNWDLLLSMNPARRPKMVCIETWNELHEGTDIAHSKEYGRQYIDITREYARLWKANTHRKPTGPYANAREVSLTFGPNGKSEGLALKVVEDGQVKTGSSGGIGWVETAPNRFSDHRYIYFDVDSSFYFDGDGDLEVTVEYLDEGRAPFGLQYDSDDPTATMAGAYKDLPPVPRADTGQWKRAAFRLTGARLVNRQNGGADFRLHTTGSFKVRRVAVRKV